MSLLVETIKLGDGCFFNADLHQRRLNHARKMLLGENESFNLIEFLHSLKVPSVGLFKCRVIFSYDIQDVQITPYQLRKISTVQLVCHDEIEYPFKFLERLLLDELFNQRENSDEILVVKKGLITDAYYYNVVFQKDDLYFTPSIPLLNGVQRQFLLKKKKIIKKMIRVEDIYTYDYIHLINALTPLHAIKIPTHHIVKQNSEKQ